MGALKAIRSWWPVGLVIAGASVFLHLRERHEYKIVADEVGFSSTAMQMHFEREAATVLRGYKFAGNFTLSTVYDLTGYRVANVFLNVLVLDSSYGSV